MTALMTASLFVGLVVIGAICLLFWTAVVLGSHLDQTVAEQKRQAWGRKD